MRYHPVWHISLSASHECQLCSCPKRSRPQTAGRPVNSPDRPPYLTPPVKLRSTNLYLLRLPSQRALRLPNGNRLLLPSKRERQSQRRHSDKGITPNRLNLHPVANRRNLHPVPNPPTKPRLRRVVLSRHRSQRPPLAAMKQSRQTRLRAVRRCRGYRAVRHT
jgi:hypothetical protein